MKKITISFIALAMSAISFAALNPFAYGLKSELSVDKSELTVSYSLNAEATSVKVVILNGEEAVKTVDCTDKGLAKGDYTVTIPTADLPINTDLTWKVEVTGAAHNTTNNHGGYSFYHPSGVDVDNNPESPYFGRIICNEGMQSVSSKTDTYLSANFGAGIFAFNAAFEPMPNGDKPGYNGGNSFVNTHNLYTTTNSKGETVYNQTAYVVRRVRISDDGRIFVTSMNPTQDAYLWEVNPDNLNEWNPVFVYEKKDDSYNIVDKEGKYIAGPNVGFDVTGQGEDLKLLMLSGDIKGMQFAFSGYKCVEYNIGENVSWESTPSREVFSSKYVINYSGSQVQYDNEGGVWLCQNRGTATNAQPALVHWDATGKEDYKELLNGLTNAGFRFNNDFTKVIIADAKPYAKIYDVAKDENGAPVLTLWKTIDMSDMGANLNDFAWDIANNVYVVGNSSEWIRAYALARTADDVATTPAASQYIFNLQGVSTYIENVEVAPQAQKIVRDGQVLLIRDGKTFNMMGQEVK